MPMTDAIAEWLAPRYAVSARRRLAEAKDEAERYEMLRVFVKDWALLRGVDLEAERVFVSKRRMQILQLLSPPAS